jgi:hypothetical protein
MKTLILACLALPLTAFAQVSLNEYSVKSGASYANSQKDTTAVLRLAGASLLSAKLVTKDTAAVDVYIQYSANYYDVPAAQRTWTTVVTDSLVYANTGYGFAQYSIRDTDSDALDGVTGAIRTVLAFRSSGNGVTTPTYTLSYVFR